MRQHCRSLKREALGHARPGGSANRWCTTPEDLDLLNDTPRRALGRASPSKAAGSDTFRVDHVTAVIAAMQETGDAAATWPEDGVRVIPGFRSRLRATIAGLEQKGLVTMPVAGMPAAAGGYEAGLLLDLVEPDEQPAVLDRYLSQLCMEVLFNIRQVYPLPHAERYSASGKVCRRLRAKPVTPATERAPGGPQAAMAPEQPGPRADATARSPLLSTILASASVRNVRHAAIPTSVSNCAHHPPIPHSRAMALRPSREIAVLLTRC
ncbi:MAG: hypothetical protein IPI33_09270 [Dehalococcoidia bacterium]|nr:hypothetical protein [Dehalococcoidia bacterium]